MTTKSEQDHLDRIHAMPCIACVLDGYTTQCGKTEAHHLVDKGYRKHSGGHFATLPLGAWHHRGEPLSGYTKSQMGLIFGPSFAVSKRQFVGKYGTERDLLKRVEAMLTRKAVA